MDSITGTKNFWNTVKPFMTDKGVSTRNITLVNNNKVVCTDREIANTMNNFFSNAVKSLNLQSDPYLLKETSINDPIDKIIDKYQTHPSVIRIKEKVNASLFSFTEVSHEELEREINEMDAKKATTFQNIPTKLLKETSDILCQDLLNTINNDINNCNFPNELKLADITPVLKKGDSTNTKNYRPVSVLPPVSKIYEKLMYKQIFSHLEKYLSPQLCGYRTGFSTQHALLSLIENLKMSLDKHSFGGAVLMDLSKAFDTINHELLIAKLEAYDFNKNALKFIQSYLSNRWQHTKINNSFSSWTKLLEGVPQGSILGPLLFNIYINDLFFIINETKICNYADDTTLFDCDKNLNDLMINLEHDSAMAISWFKYNYMKLNEEKCHLLIFGHRYEHIWAKIGETRRWENNNVMLLGVKINNNLNFNKHISTVCSKTASKLAALTRLSKILNEKQRRRIFKAFLDSQFNYCPLIWMFHSRTLNSKINKLQERALRIVFNDNTSSFDQLLEKDNSVRIHIRNLQYLVMYKIKHKISPKIIQEIFPIRSSNYNFRNQSYFKFHNPQTSNYGLNSTRYLGPKIWSLLPEKIRLLPTLSEYKTEVKKFRFENCPCRICKNYVADLGFL